MAADRIRLRRLASAEYFDPQPILVELRKLEYVVSTSDLPIKIKTLRTNILKPERENRDAALFTYAMSMVLGCRVFAAPVEEEDFDFIARWIDHGTDNLCRVQHKEVPPEALNANASVQSIISALARYADLSDITVAIKLNRVAHFEPTLVVIPASIKVAALWIYGAVSADQNEWAIWGDFAEGPVTTGRRFLYPGA